MTECYYVIVVQNLKNQFVIGIENHSSFFIHAVEDWKEISFSMEVGGEILVVSSYS